jgi:hypothetical protein
MEIQTSIRRGLAIFLAGATISGATALSAQVLGPQPSVGPATVAGRDLPAPATAFNPAPALADLQLRPVGDVTRRKHHYETEAVMSDGRRVVVSFDLSGRLWEVEHAEHDRRRAGGGPASADASLDAARAAGFLSASVLETKRHHTVVAAMTRKNEAVELHIDGNGAIYKQVWVRR